MKYPVVEVKRTDAPHGTGRIIVNGTVAVELWGNWQTGGNYNACLEHVHGRRWPWMLRYDVNGGFGAEERCVGLDEAEFGLPSMETGEEQLPLTPRHAFVVYATVVE